MQRLGHRAGVHVARWPPRSGTQRQRLLAWLDVDVLLDVGANVGGYAAAVRDRGYEGQIVSFEPMSAAFRELDAAARDDPRWAVRHMGLGKDSGEAEINISADSVSSSILPMARRHLETMPDENRYVGTETIRIETLDSAAAEFIDASSRVGLKMDVQGYELAVLRGGADVLRRAVFVQTEMLLGEFYEGQPTFRQLTDTLYDAGFRLGAFEQGHIDRQTGAVQWGDGIFVRAP